MFLLTTTGGFHVGDMIFQFILFLIVFAAVAGIVSVFIIFNKRNKRLSRVEEKVNKLLEDKGK